MRIRDLDCSVYRVHIGRQMSDAIQRIAVIENVVVNVTTDEGVRGMGYTYTHGEGGRAIKLLIDEMVSPMVCGEDPRNVERVWDKMFWGLHAIGSSGFTHLAIAAVDIALWDIIAKERGLPLYKALGGHRERIPLYGTAVNLYWPLEEVLSHLQGYLDEGVRGIKIKVGRPDLGEDIERLQAVRKLIGPSMPFFVDGNQGWTVAEAMNRARAYEPFNLSWLEEPIVADDHVGYGVLARSVNIPLAAGETHYNRFEFADLLDRKAIGFCQADVARCGGITEWMRIAHLAESYNVPMAPHACEELHTHLCCAVLNGYIIEHGRRRGPGAFTEHPVQKDGYFTPVQKPGHGLEFRPEWMAQNKLA